MSVIPNGASVGVDSMGTGSATVSLLAHDSLNAPAVQVRRVARLQSVATILISILAAVFGLVGVSLPFEDRTAAYVAVAVIVALGGIAVCLTDLAIGRRLDILVQTAVILRQSAGERAADLARTNAALHRQGQEHTDLIATMSHELRTPLNAIIGYSRLLLDELDGPLSEDQRADAEQIQSGGLGLLRIVNGTLDLARLNAGGLVVEAAPVHIWTVAEEVVALLRSLADEKGLQLSSTISPNVPPVLADEERLRQVLMNLVGNAIKFTEAGSVAVGATRSGDYVTIAIEDTGIGIAPSAQHLIFEPFRQGDQGNERSHGGTGLGLAITHRLVSLMGGTIRVESAVGHGSTFLVALPRAFESRTGQPHEVSFEPARDVALLADPNRGRELASALTRQGLAVACSDGTDWEALPGDCRPRMVLVDALQPNGGAWRLLQALGGSGWWPNVRVGLVGLGADAQACALSLPSSLSVISGTELDSVLSARLHQISGDTRAPVLIVSSDSSWRQRVTTVAQAAGLGVHEAAHGDAALAVARRVPASAIVVDLLVGSPGILELVAELVAASGRRASPVLIVAPAGLTPREQRDLHLGSASWLAASSRLVNDVAADIHDALRLDPRATAAVEV